MFFLLGVCHAHAFARVGSARSCQKLEEARSNEVNLIMPRCFATGPLRIVILDQRNVFDFLEPNDLPKLWQEMYVPWQADAVRLALLAKYGGATCVGWCGVFFIFSIRLLLCYI